LVVTRDHKCGKPQEHVLALFYKSESKEAVTKPEIISKFSGIKLTHCYKEDYNKWKAYKRLFGALLLMNVLTKSNASILFENKVIFDFPFK